MVVETIHKKLSSRFRGFVGEKRIDRLSETRQKIQRHIDQHGYKHAIQDNKKRIGFTATILGIITVFNFSLVTNLVLVGTVAAAWMLPNKQLNQLGPGENSKQQDSLDENFDFVEVDLPEQRVVDPFGSEEVYDPFMDKDQVGFLDVESEDDRQVIQVKQ